MYCNICSKIVKKSHFKTKTHKKSEKKVTDILLDVVGGEMGLVKQILDYKQDMEYQEKTIKMERMTWVKHFKNLKEYKLTNTFEKKIKLTFKNNHCYLKLDEVIILKRHFLSVKKLTHCNPTCLSYVGLITLLYKPKLSPFIFPVLLKPKNKKGGNLSFTTFQITALS